MKRFFVSLGIVYFLSVAASCQDQNDIDSLNDIASSIEFQNYTIAHNNIKVAIAQDLWDPKEILSIVTRDFSPENYSPCELNESDFDSIRGISDFLKFTCDRERTLQELHNAHDYRRLSTDKMKYIREYYHKHVNPGYKGEILELIQKGQDHE